MGSPSPCSATDDTTINQFFLYGIKCGITCHSQVCTKCFWRNLGVFPCFLSIKCPLICFLLLLLSGSGKFICNGKELLSFCLNLNLTLNSTKERKVTLPFPLPESKSRRKQINQNNNLLFEECTVSNSQQLIQNI